MAHGAAADTPEDGRNGAPNAQQPSWILVVDDDRELCAALSRHLKAWGYLAHIAHTARKALELCEARMPGLALIDIMMPGMNGWQLSKRLIQRSDAPPIFLISATFKVEEHNPNAGVVACLPKPIELARLRELIDQTLNRAADTPPR